MDVEESEIEQEYDNSEEDAASIWEKLSPEQRKYFKKLCEKNPDNMRYIG